VGHEYTPSQNKMEAPEVDVREETLALFETLGDITPLEAKDLEIGVYNSSIEYGKENGIPLTWTSPLFRETYLAKARSIYCNLNPDSYVGNKNLHARMKEREFLPHELSFKPRDMVFPEAWRHIIDNELLRNKAAYEVTSVAMTDQVTCGKCKKTKVSYFDYQIRSADEGTSTFYNCLVCGHRWKI